MVGSALGLYLSDSKSSGNVLGAVGFGVVFGLPCLWAIWRSATAGLLLSEDMIAVRGPIRTRRISPALVVAFEPGVFGFVGNGTPGPILKVADGRQIGIWALGREGLVWNAGQYMEEALPLCEQLNRMTEQVKGNQVDRTSLVAPDPYSPISSMR